MVRMSHFPFVAFDTSLTWRLLGELRQIMLNGRTPQMTATSEGREAKMCVQSIRTASAAGMKELTSDVGSTSI